MLEKFLCIIVDRRQEISIENNNLGDLFSTRTKILSVKRNIIMINDRQLNIFCRNKPNVEGKKNICRPNNIRYV